MTDLSVMIQRYSVPQDYHRYTEENHATWRTAVHRLHGVLKDQTAIDFLTAFEKTGMSKDRIPRLEEINDALERVGWRAIVVDGFIPPDVFMTLQANQILPITKTIRSNSQLDYTPVPDILHEAAGHLPMLHLKAYRDFLRRLGQLGANASLSRQDIALYEKQKKLAELESNGSTQQNIIKLARIEVRRAAKVANSCQISSARKIARFHWWTVEYGLIGNSHAIFGAGLLSSWKEAQNYRSVPHSPLSVKCCEQSFDIDHVQPMYFVAESWLQIARVMDELEKCV